jgi:hypothetical protein
LRTGNGSDPSDRKINPALLARLAAGDGLELRDGA